MLNTTKGRSFWGKKDEDEEKLHLRFIISDPDLEGNVLVVSMTTRKNLLWEDLSCVLRSEDHERVKHESFIYYEKAEEMNEACILNMYFNNRIILRENISSELLTRIQKGAKKSKRLTNKFKKYFDYF